MISKTKTAIAAITLLALALLAPAAARAGFRDYSTDPATGQSTIAARDSSPSPSAAASNINDYTHMEDILTIDPKSGKTAMLRTDQKNGLNEYVPYLIAIENLNMDAVRELRPIARKICGMEGGFAQIARNPTSGKRYVQVTCTRYQLPFLFEAIQALDKTWLNSTDDGSGRFVYKAHYRDIDTIDSLTRQFTGGDSVLDKEDNSIVHVNTISYVTSYDEIAKTIDIPAHEITIDTKFYETDMHNDLKLGLDYIAWKDGPGWNLFEFGASSWGERMSTYDWAFSQQTRDTYYGYTALMLSSYYDFLASKGKAKVLARASLQTVSGVEAHWDSLDAIAGIVSWGDEEPTFIDTKQVIRITPSETSQLRLIAQARSTVGDRPYVIPETDGYIDRERLIPMAHDLLETPPLPEYALPEWQTSVIYLQLQTTENIFYLLWYVGYPEDFLINMQYSLWVYGYYSAPISGKTWNRHTRYEDYGKVGLQLKVRPVVGTKSTEMSIVASSSDLIGYTPQGQPLTSACEINTFVRMRDGEQVVVAGLTRREKVKQKSGIPWLSDLPLLGYCFGGETKVDRVKRIVILFEPTIYAGMVSVDDGRALSDSEIDELKAEGNFGDMTPRSMDISAATAEIRALAQDDKKPETPSMPLGFDMWGLDPEKE